MPELRVFGYNHDGRERRIVAATSMKEVAAITGASVARIRKYGGETKNREEIELAMRSPGRVWTRKYKSGSQWQELNQ